MRYEASEGVGERRRRAPRAVLERLSLVAAALLFTAGLAVCVAFARSSERFWPTLLFSLLALLLFLPLIGHLSLRVARVCNAMRCRLAVRRTRAAFRSALEAAERHPELVDLKRLRTAANHLRQIYDTYPLSVSLPEIERAIEHPYAPIREAARLVVEAPGNSKSSPTPFGS